VSCLDVARTKWSGRMLDAILKLPGFESMFIRENRRSPQPHEQGVTVTVGDSPPHRHLSQGGHSALPPASSSKTNGRSNPKEAAQAVRDAGGTLIYVIGIGAAATGSATRIQRRGSPTYSKLSSRRAVRRALLDRVSARDPVAGSAVTAILTATPSACES